jgi:pyridoxine 5-phosphate synthase
VEYSNTKARIMPTKLSVNLNAVAMLRNRRDLPWPNVEHIAHLALGAGANGLTLHPRPDQRHARDSDLPVMRALIDDEFPKAEFNIEGYPTRHFIDLVLANEPEQVTLVPDEPGQATSDHGWDFRKYGEMLAPIVAELKSGGCRVALFCDSDVDEEAVTIASDIGTDRQELYTEPYAAAMDNEADVERQVEFLANAAGFARSHGLALNAGHDLTVANLPLILSAITDLAEVSIGHGLTADALEFGMVGAVKRFLLALGHQVSDGDA